MKLHLTQEEAQVSLLLSLSGLNLRQSSPILPIITDVVLNVFCLNDRLLFYFLIQSITSFILIISNFSLLTF